MDQILQDLDDIKYITAEIKSIINSQQNNIDVIENHINDSIIYTKPDNIKTSYNYYTKRIKKILYMCGIICVIIYIL